MRYALFTLLGFTFFATCQSFCAANMQTTAVDHSDHGSVHAHMHTEHDTNEAGCDHCEETCQQDLALTNQTSDTGSFSLVSVAMHYMNLLENQSAETLPLRTHLAAADPPLAATIVSTVVLRT